MLIITKFIGPTNYRGARIKATLDRKARHDDARNFSITVSCDYQAGGGIDGAHMVAAQTVANAWNDAVRKANPGMSEENMGGLVEGTFGYAGESCDERGYVYACVSPYAQTFKI